MFSAALHGFILAFGLIIPLGVQNIFVFNQGVLHKSLRPILPVVVIAAICDSLLIILAVTGVSLLVLGIPWVKNLLLGGGTLFLVYMGWVTWSNTPNTTQKEEEVLYAPRKQIAFALSVSLLNPHAIIDTIGVLGTSSLKYVGNEKIAFALACIVISWTWFFGLGLAGTVTGRVDNNGKFIFLLNKGSALIILGVAFYLGQAFFK